jgi:hypothetical protein
MNGVEILNVTGHAIMEHAWSWQMCFGLFIGLTCFCVLIGLIQGICDCDVDGGVLAGLIVGLICALTLSPICTVIFSRKEIGKEYHYKVTIDDSVSMNEFLDKYEILDQEGKIYTVKERD